MVMRSSAMFLLASLMTNNVCGIVASNPDRVVDCRKFVFAPLCRGVAAKRNLLSSGHYEPGAFIVGDSNQQFSTYLDAAIAPLGINSEDDNQSGISARKQNEMKNIERMYQQDKINRFLRLLIGIRKDNSERDNFFGQEFENL